MIRAVYQAYRNDEFVVYYQPVFGMESGRLVGFEALLRWQHEKHGALHPSEFLGLLEESGLIVPVGERVLQEACQFVREMQESGQPGLRVCVNVSGRQLEDGGFILAMLDAIYDANIASSSLQIELSEQVLKDHPATLSRLFPEIRHAGVRVAIDQVGVTELAPGDLLRFPVSLIKVDRSLVTGVTGDAVAQAMVSGVMKLARSAGVDIAAVGVEADEQLGILNSMGFKEAQGRLFAPPRPAASFLDALFS